MDMFPTSPDELTATGLSSALGRTVEGFSLVPIGAARGNLGEIVRVDFDDGSPPVVAKFAAAHEANIDAARRSGLFEREVQFYRRLAPSLNVRTPTCHAGAYDPDTGRFFLLLEHVASIDELDTIRGIGADRTAMLLGELAKLHEAGVHFPNEPWLQAMEFQGRIDNISLLIEQGWPKLSTICGDLVEPLDARWLTDRFVALMGRMSELDRTIVHGDVKPDNAQLLADGVALLDWQAVGYGPPAWDVASAMITCLTLDDRRAHEARLLADYPHDLTGYEEALLFGLVVATALTVLGDPDQARRLRLIRTMAKRSIAALEDHRGW